MRKILVTISSRVKSFEGYLNDIKSSLRYYTNIYINIYKNKISLTGDNLDNALNILRYQYRNDKNIAVFEFNKNIMNNYLAGNIEAINILKPHIDTIKSQISIPDKSLRTWYTCAEIKKIYNFPSIDLSVKKCIGVVSFGGGLYGTLQNNGVLINGDVQEYWTLMGISPSNHPQVIVNVLPGAVFDSNANGTDENTLDVEIIGSLYPSSNLTIILFIAPNSNSGFYNIFDKMINGSVVSGNTTYKCNIINCSWGSPEVYIGKSLMNSVNNLFSYAISKGVNICVATGDNGASDGVGGLNLDFPSSSPNTIACGGTTLNSLTTTYEQSTTETAWSFGGGGISSYFKSPQYQYSLNKTYRSSPDIAMNADPSTGLLILLGGNYYIFGGTSAVAPYISALICSMGINYFLNSRSYQINRSSYHDIVSGNNGYYNAVSGYDASTGLGSVNGINLLNNLNSFVPISSVTMNKSSFNVVLGSQSIPTISVNILPINATNKSLLWSSSNNSIATVSSNGILTLYKKGIVVITATTLDGTNKITNVILNITQITNNHH